MREIDYSIVDHRFGLEPILKEFADSLFPCAADRLCILVSKLKKRLPIRLRPTRYSTEINADFSKARSEINVNEALFIFYHKMLKVFAVTLNVGFNDTKIIEKTSIPWKTVVLITDNLIRAYLEDRILLQGGFKLEELTEGQETVAGLLREGCEILQSDMKLDIILSTKLRTKFPNIFLQTMQSWSI